MSLISKITKDDFIKRLKSDDKMLARHKNYERGYKSWLKRKNKKIRKIRKVKKDGDTKSYITRGTLTDKYVIFKTYGNVRGEYFSYEMLITKKSIKIYQSMFFNQRSTGKGVDGRFIYNLYDPELYDSGTNEYSYYWQHFRSVFEKTPIIVIENFYGFWPGFPTTYNTNYGHGMLILLKSLIGNRYLYIGDHHISLYKIYKDKIIDFTNHNGGEYDSNSIGFSKKGYLYLFNMRLRIKNTWNYKPGEVTWKQYDELIKHKDVEKLEYKLCHGLVWWENDE